MRSHLGRILTGGKTLTETEDQMKIRVQLEYVKLIGGELRRMSRAHEGRLCGNVGFAAPGGMTGIAYDTVVAMIDTGADLNYADPALIEKYGCPVESSTTTFAGTGSEQSTLHTCRIIFPTHGFGINTQVVSLPSIRLGEQPYQLILGSLFLELCRLHLDSPNGEWWLDIDTTISRG